MRESIVLTAQERTSTGKGGARKLRAEGFCPAVVYGPGVDAKPLQVDPRALQKLLHSAGENALIDLSVSGAGGESSTLKVIVREMTFPPLGDIPEHVDFYHVSLDRSLSVSVAVELTGVSEVVETKAGTLSQLVHELSVECLPTDIPESIKVDISSIKLGHSLHVSDLDVPAGVTITDSPDLPIVSLNAIREEEEEAEVAPELESAEPELVKAPKEGEEEAAG